MERKYISFSQLSELEQEYFLTETWCDECEKADLGLKDPVMYKEDEKTFIAGKCILCGEPQISEIITKNIDG